MKLILSDRALNISIDNSSDTIQYIDLTQLNISNCTGCFGCWTKTPGKCVIRDDAVKVYPYIAQSDTLLYISRIKYGGYDTVMKTMLERSCLLYTSITGSGICRRRRRRWHRSLRGSFRRTMNSC